MVGGNVELERVSVHDCVAHGSFTAHGGGVAGWNSLRLTSSVVYASSAIVDETGFPSIGGGAYGGRWLTLDHSLLCHNEAASGGGGWAAETLTARYSTVRNNVGGGAQALAGTVERSTFSHNVGAGLEIGVAINSFSKVVNSTFSSNRGSGLLVGGDALLAQNTIAYNTAPRVGGTCPGGLDLASGALQMRGNLVAHNACDGIPLDFTRGSETSFVLPTDGNLIMYAASPVPPGTLSSDPRLLPLANNGGPTLTHALAVDSPAIDAGSGDENAKPYDQRGIGFRRIVGGHADIGAFERQQP
ncbi:MAG: choice-of-anchor Q domain-containing protein [Luteimonas sp.]